MQASPAARAGMIDGDRILSLAGRPVASATELVAALRGVRVGGEVEVVVLRGAEKITLTVQLAAR
jgi:putative serine protease PepD